MPDNTPREPDYDYPSFVARFRSTSDVFMAGLVKWVDTYSARIATRSILTERGFEYFGEDALRLARSGSRPAEGIPRTETVSLFGVRTLAYDGKGRFAFEHYGPLIEVHATPRSHDVIEVECFLYDAQVADYFAALCDEITGIGRACGGLELVYPAPQPPSEPDSSTIGAEGKGEAPRRWLKKTRAELRAAGWDIREYRYRRCEEIAELYYGEAALNQTEIAGHTGYELATIKQDFYLMRKYGALDPV